MVGRAPMTLQREEIKEQRRRDENQKNLVDLDEIIEKWVWKMWELSKRTREDSKYRREELDMKLIWKRVHFWQNDANFTRSNQIRLPKSQILFKTNFTNQTNREQEYSLRAERSTTSTLNFTFTRGFTKEKESSIRFKLPNEVLEVGGGLRHEQRVEFGKDTTVENRMSWSADSSIRVAPNSKANAELCITEEEYSADFSVEIRFSGRITAVINAKNPNVHFYKYIEGDIATIFADALRTGIISNQFEIHDATQTVRTMFFGQCAFRYGIEQHVNVEQQSLTENSSMLNNESPPKYRPMLNLISNVTN